MKALLALAAALSLHAQTPALTFALPNGLRVVLQEDHDHPLIRVRLHLRLTPEDQTQANALLRALAVADAGWLKPEAFGEALERAGIQLRGTPDPDGLLWRLAARTRDQDLALGLLADQVTHPVFPGMLPDAPEALRDRLLRPDRALLLLQGDLGPEQARRLALLHLGAWTATTPPPPPPARPAGPTPEAAALLALLVPEEMPEAAQRALAFTEAEVARARTAWTAGRARVALHPEARADAALDEALGRAPRPERVAALDARALQEALGPWLDQRKRR